MEQVYKYKVRENPRHNRINEQYTSFEATSKDLRSLLLQMKKTAMQNYKEHEESRKYFITKR